MHADEQLSSQAHAARRPDFAPENRSAGAGKVVAVAVFALLLAGALATLVVVLTRGRTKFADPDAGLARPPAEMQPADAAAGAPSSTDPAQSGR